MSQDREESGRDRADARKDAGEDRAGPGSTSWPPQLHRYGRLEELTKGDLETGGDLLLLLTA